MASAIEGLQSTPVNPPTTNDRVGNSALGKDDFLKLLVTQLGNQDPTKPTESSAFVAELAQFSLLETQQGTNSRLDTLLLAQASQNSTAAVGFIGKVVNYRTDAIDLQNGMSVVSKASLAADAAEVTVNVVDGSGRTVRTLQLGEQRAGEVTVTWDGMGDGGTRMPAGSYTLRATAKTEAGASVQIDLRGSGVVSGVSFENGVPLLQVNGTKVSMSEVSAINERSSQ